MSGPTAKADWPTIREEYEAGALITDLGRRHPVSRQRIAYISKRESWKRRESLVADPVAPQGVPATKPDPIPVPAECGAELANTVFTPERGQAALDSLVEHGVLTVAASCAGVSRVTLAAWRKMSPSFDIAVQRALSRRAMRHIKLIDNAGERDWKAAEALLKANPATKEDFTQGEQAGGPPRIVINITTPEGIQDSEDPNTIDAGGTTVTIDAPSEAVNE